MAAHLVCLLVAVPGVEAVADRREVGRGLLLRRPVRGLAGGPGHTDTGYSALILALSGLYIISYPMWTLDSMDLL